MHTNTINVTVKGPINVRNRIRPILKKYDFSFIIFFSSLLGVSDCVGSMDAIRKNALGLRPRPLVHIRVEDSLETGTQFTHHFLFFSSGTKKWWTGQCLGKKRDGFPPSSSS